MGTSVEARPGAVTSAARRGTIGFVYEAGLRALELKRAGRASD